MKTLSTLLSEIPYDDQKVLDEKLNLLEIKLIFSPILKIV